MSHKNHKTNKKSESRRETPANLNKEEEKSDSSGADVEVEIETDEVDLSSKSSDSRAKKIATSLNLDDLSKLVRLIDKNLPDNARTRVVDGVFNSVLGDDGFVKQITDRNIPKEAAGFLLSSADTTRREALKLVSREVRLFLESIDLGGELSKILTSVSFEVNLKVGFVPNHHAETPTHSTKAPISDKKSGKKRTPRPVVDESTTPVPGLPTDIDHEEVTAEVLEKDADGRTQSIRDYTELLWSIVNDRLIQPSLNQEGKVKEAISESEDKEDLPNDVLDE